MYKIIESLFIFIATFIGIAVGALVVMVLLFTIFSFVFYGDFSTIFNVINWYTTIIRFYIVASIFGSVCCVIYWYTKCK